MAYDRYNVRHSVIIALLLATCGMQAGCQSVKVTVNKREPWLNRRALESEGLVMLVVADEESKRKYPHLASSVGFLLAKDMNLTAISDNREAFAAADAVGAGEAARRFADYFHRMHSIDYEALSAVSDAWMNTLGRGYVAVVSIEPPGTYHDYQHGISEDYDSSSASDFDSYQDYQAHRRNHVKTTETSTWTSGTRIIVRMYVVRIADQKLGWRIYVHGDFTEENSQSTTQDSSDSFGEAIARSLLESMFSGPGGYPAPPNVTESTRQTLKRLAASLPR